MSPKPRTRTIGYVRVSSQQQAEEGVSLDAQRAKLTAYAQLYDLTLVDVIVDAGESAKSLDRPGIQRALAMLKSGEASALLVAKLDRLTRSVSDLGRLIESHFQRAALLSVEEQIDTRSAGGRLVLNVLASVSQWEREAIGERTCTALRHKRRNGEKTGGRVPFGYASDGGSPPRLVPIPEEQAIIGTIRELAATMGTHAITTELARRGIVTRAGGRFSRVTIERVIKGAG